MQAFKIAVVVLLCVTSNAATIGDTKTENRCFLEITKGWKGACSKDSGDEYCSYEPTAGWAITSTTPVTTSSNKGNYQLNPTTMTTDKLISQDAAQQVFVALLASGQLDAQGATSVAKLMTDYTQMRSKALEEGKASYNVHAHAKAHGSCWDRKRGWIAGHVETKEIYLGKTQQDIIDWISVEDLALGPFLARLECDGTDCIIV